MDNNLKSYHEILFMDYHPRKKRDFSEVKFNDLLREVQKETYAAQPKYELDFQKPLTSKRKYYHTLISNEAIRYLNDFHHTMALAKDNEKKYNIHNSLTKVITPKLNRINKEINDNQYFFDQLDPKSKKKVMEKNILDETYILQFLKHQLIRLYLEVQGTYENHLKDKPISEDELHQLYFSEQAPEESLIIKIVGIPRKPASEKEDKLSFGFNDDITKLKTALTQLHIKITLGNL